MQPISICLSAAPSVTGVHQESSQENTEESCHRSRQNFKSPQKASGSQVITLTRQVRTGARLQAGELDTRTGHGDLRGEEPSLPSLTLLSGVESQCFMVTETAINPSTCSCSFKSTKSAMDTNHSTKGCFSYCQHIFDLRQRIRKFKIHLQVLVGTKTLLIYANILINELF